MSKVPNKIRPRANEIVISANFIIAANEDKKVIDKDQQMIYFDEFQTVLRVGSVVRDINVGDVICVNPKRFAKYQEQKSRVRAAVEGYEKVLIGYDFPIISTSFGDVMLITDGDVKYIIEDGFCEMAANEENTPIINDEISSNYEEERCNTFSPNIASPKDLKKDFPNE
jgi:hypothetical protein